VVDYHLEELWAKAIKFYHLNENTHVEGDSFRLPPIIINQDRNTRIVEVLDSNMQASIDFEEAKNNNDVSIRNRHSLRGRIRVAWTDSNANTNINSNNMSRSGNNQ